MYKVAEITFRPLMELKDPADKVDDVLYDLYKNGQILKDYIVEAKDNGEYVATVTTTDDDSLEEKYQNAKLYRAFDDFDEDIRILGDDALAVDSCHCEDHSYYILSTDPYEEASPVICGDCGKEIPLIRIPYLNYDDDYSAILDFQNACAAMNTLWAENINTDYAEEQITDPDSELNQKGRYIRLLLEGELDKTVYYSVRTDLNACFDAPSACPICKRDLGLIKNSLTYKVCPKCSLAFATDEEDEEK